MFGGKSVEHEVSVISGIQAIMSMDQEKYEVIPVYLTKKNEMYVGEEIGKIEAYKDIPGLLSKSQRVILVNEDDHIVLMPYPVKLFGKKGIEVDIAFPIVHGTNVEDGALQGYLKTIGIPFVGCDVTASALGMDKYASKVVLKENGVPVLDGYCFTTSDYAEIDSILDKVEKEIGYPAIVKPVDLGSSVGISVARNRSELTNSIDDAFLYARKIIIEHAITKLREINCAVLGDENEAIASECEEPLHTKDILSYEDLKHWESSVCYDEEIRDEICAEEAYVYPYEAEQNVPVKISVTELKRLELQARQMEEVVWVDSELPEVGAAEGIRMPDLTQTGENEEETNKINDIPRPRFLAEKEQLSGAQRGTVYHLVFEHLPYELLDEHSDASVLERWLQSFASKGYLTPQELAVIRADDFIAFLRTDIGRRMRAAALAGKLQREQQFMMGFDADKLYPEVTHGDMVLVQGIIDAWFWEDDEIVLVDYKTDHVRNDLRELADKYRIQLEYYAEALERVTGHTVREKIIYSVRKRDFIRV